MVDDPDGWPTPINARAETVAEKPAFRGAFDERRCLVLAVGFYERAGERGRTQPYRVTRPDGEPFAMSGLWKSWEADGETLFTTAVNTTDANDTGAPIHTRMPVILDRTDERAWLETRRTTSSRCSTRTPTAS